MVGVISASRLPGKCLAKNPRHIVMLQLFLEKKHGAGRIQRYQTKNSQFVIRVIYLQIKGMYVK